MVAGGFWAWLDRRMWFYGDEWDFIANRRVAGGFGTGPHGIWAPHNEHWSTLPILAWRGLFSVFGLSSYWPYLALLLACHLIVVHLVWRLSTRSGALPAVATALAGLLGVLGSGWEDLTWAFQIGFVGSLAFGLGAVLVAGTSDPSPGWRRGCAVSALTLASLMCSSVGDVMLVALAVQAVMRPARRLPALAPLSLPAAAYAAWWLVIGHTGLTIMRDTVNLSTFGRLPRFMWAQLANALGSGVFALGCAAVAGLAIWSLRHASRLGHHRADVVGLAAGAVTFVALAGMARDRLRPLITPSRYVYINVALLLPLIALALSDLASTNLFARRSAARRTGARVPRANGRRRFVPNAGVLAASALISVYLIGNVGYGWVAAARRAASDQALKVQTIDTAEALAAGHPSLNPYPIPRAGEYAGYMTAARLRSLETSGLLPRGRPADRTARLVDDSWLDIVRSGRPLGGGKFVLYGSSARPVPGGTGCTGVPGGKRHVATARLLPEARTGSRHVSALEISAPTRLRLAVSVAGAPISRGRTFDLASHAVLWLDDDTMRAIVVQARGAAGVRLCHLSRARVPPTPFRLVHVLSALPRL